MAKSRGERQGHKVGLQVEGNPSHERPRGADLCLTFCQVSAACFIEVLWHSRRDRAHDGHTQAGGRGRAGRQVRKIRVEGKHVGRGDRRGRVHNLDST